MVVVLIFGWIYALKVPSVRLKFDYIKIKMPAAGKLMVKIYEGRFARTLSSLYSSGIPMVECLERSSRILGNAYVDKMFIQVVDEVKQGAPLSASLAKQRYLKECLLPSSMSVRNQVLSMRSLRKLLTTMRKKQNAAVTRLVGLMEPLLIVFMGVAIGLCLAGIFPLLYGSLSGLEN